MARTERESDRRKGEEKWQTCWCCRDQQRACRMAQASAKKLEHTGPTQKRKSGLSATERAVGKYAGAALAKRKKEQSHLSRVPDHEGERVKMGQSCTLARVRWIRTRAWKGKGGLHRERRQISRRKGRANKKSLPRTSRRKHERKSSPGRSAKPWCTPSLAKPEMGKEVGRQRARS